MQEKSDLFSNYFFNSLIFNTHAKIKKLFLVFQINFSAKNTAQLITSGIVQFAKNGSGKVKVSARQTDTIPPIVTAN
jgi:hypothetical protein